MATDTPDDETDSSEQNDTFFSGDMSKPPAFALMGPTASGKTDLAMALADRFPVEIISVDSSLVYRGMDIGSAKPDAETLAKYPHHLVDVRNPDEPYSASEFRADALTLMHAIRQRGNVPLLVGGTMLYFKVLIEGIAEMPVANAEIRQAIVARAEKLGWQAIHDELNEVDPISAARIHPNDSQRLQRALEVYQLSGKSLTELQARTDESGDNPFDICSIALMTDNRALLHNRIEQRFKQMLQQGFVEEVRGLKQQYPAQSELPAMRAVGYRQVWQYLDGEFDEKDMVDKGVAATRQLAKRQITWLRSWPRLTRYDLESKDVLESLSKKITERLEIMEAGPHSKGES